MGESINELTSSKKIEIVKYLHENQTSLLRFMTQVDLKILLSYCTLQLVLGAWFAESPVTDVLVSFGVIVINLGFTVTALTMVRLQQKRRSEVAGTLKNINQFLRLTDTGYYVKDTTLMASSKFRPAVNYYYWASGLAFLGSSLVIIIAP